MLLRFGLVFQLDTETCEESTEEPIYRQAVDNINALKRDTPQDFLPFYDTTDTVDIDLMEMLQIRAAV
jgi:hypothetical protein